MIGAARQTEHLSRIDGEPIVHNAKIEVRAESEPSVADIAH